MHTMHILLNGHVRKMKIWRLCNDLYASDWFWRFRDLKVFLSMTRRIRFVFPNQFSLKL